MEDMILYQNNNNTNYNIDHNYS